MWSARRTRHVQQEPLPGRPVQGDGPLEQVPGAVHLVHPGQVRPALPGPLEREVGVEVAVRALGPGDLPGHRSPSRPAPVRARRPGHRTPLRPTCRRPNRRSSAPGRAPPFVPAARRKLSIRPVASHCSYCCRRVTRRVVSRRPFQKPSSRRTAPMGTGRRRAWGLRLVSVTAPRCDLSPVSTGHRVPQRPPPPGQGPPAGVQCAVTPALRREGGARDGSDPPPAPSPPEPSPPEQPPAPDPAALQAQADDFRAQAEAALRIRDQVPRRYPTTSRTPSP